MQNLSLNYNFSNFFYEFTSGFSTSKKSASITSDVSGLSQSDIQNVYHHLYVGRKLSLKISFNQIEIYYRNHFLGFLPELSCKKVLTQIETGKTVQVTISDLKKYNYDIITKLELKIKFQ